MPLHDPPARPRAWLGVILIALTGAACDESPTDPFDDVTWSRVRGVDGGTISALAVGSNGAVFAAGSLLYRSTDQGAAWSPTNRTEPPVSLAARGEAVYAGAVAGFVYRWNVSSQQWVGAGRLSGEGSVVDLALESELRVLAASRSGIFRTVDGGQVWTHLTESIANQTFGAVALDASGAIFAGTAAGSSVGKILASTDGGGSWFESYEAPAPIYALCVSPRGDVFAGTASGVVRSVAGGAWTHVSFGSSVVGELAIDGEGRVFAATWSDGVFRSTDYGATWSGVNASLPGASTRCLAVGADNRVYLGLEGTGVFRSTDHGDTWSEASSGLSSGSVTALGRIASNVLLVGTSFGVHRSPDDGVTWLPARLRERWVYSFLLDLAPSLFAGTDEGIFHSTDGGEGWVLLGGSPRRATAQVITPGGVILAGNTPHGVHRSSDQGVTWTAVNGGLASTSVEALLATPTGRVLVGTAHGTIYRTENDGESWALVHSFESGSSRVYGLIALSDGRIVAGTSGSGVFQSTDEGDSWHQIWSASGNSLATSPRDHLFVGSWGGVGISGNLGRSWEIVRLPTLGGVGALQMDSNGHLLAGTDADGLYRTDEPLP